MKTRSNLLTRRRLFIGAGGMASVLALAACGAMPAATTAHRSGNGGNRD